MNINSLLLLNVEHVIISPGITKVTPLDFTDYPISHSLLMALVWGVAFGCVYWLIKKNFRYSVVLAICVVSHWILDLFVHRPDLPLLPGNSIRVGFGLWNQPVLEIIIEAIIFIVGVTFYLQKTSAKNGVGKLGLWVLIALLVLVYIANIFGPPPTSISSLAWTAQVQWVFVLLAFWVDNNRVVTLDRYHE